MGRGCLEPGMAHQETLPKYATGQFARFESLEPGYHHSMKAMSRLVTGADLKLSRAGEGCPVRRGNTTTSKRCRFDIKCRLHIRTTFTSKATCKPTNKRTVSNRHRPFALGGNIFVLTCCFSWCFYGSKPHIIKEYKMLNFNRSALP